MLPDRRSDTLGIPSGGDDRVTRRQSSVGDVDANHWSSELRGRGKRLFDSGPLRSEGRSASAGWDTRCRDPVGSTDEGGRRGWLLLRWYSAD